MYISWGELHCPISKGWQYVHKWRFLSRKQRPQHADPQSRTTFSRSPGARELLILQIQAKRELKWTCYIICWGGDLLLPCYLWSIYAVLQRFLYHCRFPLQPWRFFLAAVSKHLPSVPKKSYILPTPMANKEKGRGLRSPADFCLAVHLVWQHSGGRGCAATSSLAVSASSSRDRDPEHIHSLGSINPWPGTSHQKHNSKCHIHAPTEKCQQVTRRDRGRKCSPLIFHLPSA